MSLPGNREWSTFLNVAVAGVQGSGDAQVVVDDKGNFGIAVTVCGGPATEVAGAGVGFVQSGGNSPTINDLNGTSNGGAGNISLPGSPVSPYIGGSFTEATPCPYKTGTFGAGVNVGASPVDVGPVTCRTKVISF